MQKTIDKSWHKIYNSTWQVDIIDNVKPKSGGYNNLNKY